MTTTACVASIIGVVTSLPSQLMMQALPPLCKTFRPCRVTMENGLKQRVSMVNDPVPVSTNQASGSCLTRTSGDGGGGAPARWTSR